jgi:hypothetical protein
MRVGLLTRFTGFLGMIVGGTLILPLDQFGIIRSFWLIAVGLMILGRLPGGRPPAWSKGEAVPWPTQQQLREQREAARRQGGEQQRERAGRGRNGDRAQGGARSDRMPPAQAPKPRRPDAKSGQPHPATSRRKRKRRT